jgi:3-phenylpropionate/cinnamic acid dioxygenase small subunit
MGALEEIEAIKRLKARYFRLMDTKQWDQWGDVFTEDAHLRRVSRSERDVLTARRTSCSA